jgi:hypothetical protein
MARSPQLIAAKREKVLRDYDAAVQNNHVLFLEDADQATAEYVFQNQMEDAQKIMHEFYSNNRRVISIQKKTKVGADGLMIQLATLMTTHPDDGFVVDFDDVRIITGMSNVSWEKDMINKAPNCFKDKIHHHGKLQKAYLTNIRRSLIIIDEIDTGNNEEQKLHKTLKAAGVLDVEHMIQHNNRFVFISATMIKELYNLYQWGEHHKPFKMTIPSSYIGHKDFVDLNIIQEFYPLDIEDNANRWVQEDIVNNYGDDFRVHIVRVNNKTKDFVKIACDAHNVTCKDHTSDERQNIDDYFKKPLTCHIVLCIKGFFRRANLFSNSWKLRVGATHELHTHTVDDSVQIQGLPGRLTGYWRSNIDNGHKTGPHRTSIKAIENYEKTYAEPFGSNDYHTARFKKRNGSVHVMQNTMLSHENITNLEPIDLPGVPEDPTEIRKSIPIVIQLTQTHFDEIWCKKIGNRWPFETIKSIIENNSNDTWQKIKGMDRPPIQCPSIGSRSRNVTIARLVNASESNSKCSVWTSEKTKVSKADTYQIWLDDENNKLIVSIYYGSEQIG